MSENETKPNAEGGSSNALHGVNGNVKWFDPRKGFGFIIGPEGQDIFVHFTVIEGEGFRVLKDGSSVTYDAEQNEKGWRATRVHREVPEGEDTDAPEVVVPRRTYSRTPGADRTFMRCVKLIRDEHPLVSVFLSTTQRIG